MKNQFLFVAFIMVLSMSLSCGNQKASSDNKINSTTEANADSTLYVYYFHTNIRCETCVAVDEHTHDYLKILFPEKMKSGEIVFNSFNMEEKGHEDLVKKYEIWGQTLLFIKGDIAIDRTNDAFLNVTTDPEKWKSMVKKQVEDLLKK